MNNWDYPEGADTPDAPWNEIDNPDKEVEVTVVLTLSKTVKVSVNDYTVVGDYIDFSTCNLHAAVEEQICLPANLANVTKEVFTQDLSLKASGMPLYLKEAVEDCSNWDVVDYEVIME